MPAADILRNQIESALADRIPHALTFAPQAKRQMVSTGIRSADDLLSGGFLVGALTEIVGQECSGRTSLGLSFFAQITKDGKVCAWVDASDALSPESAAAAGVDLSRLLWVRCGFASNQGQTQDCAHARAQGWAQTKEGRFELPEACLAAPPVTKGLHGGGGGAHPRSEVKGLHKAVGELLRRDAAPRCAEPLRREPAVKEAAVPVTIPGKQGRGSFAPAAKPWVCIDQALRVTDLLLQAGGFSAVVLDLGSMAAEHVLRVPLATWFRYRAAAERTQMSIVLLTQHACAKSSAGLVLHLDAGRPLLDESTVLAGLEHRLAIARERFGPVASKVVPLRRPPQSERDASWQSRTAWGGGR